MQSIPINRNIRIGGAGRYRLASSDENGGVPPYSISRIARYGPLKLWCREWEDAAARPGASTPQSQGGMKMIYLMQAESKTPTPSASASGSDVHSNGSGVKVTSTPPMVIVT